MVAREAFGGLRGCLLSPGTLGSMATTRYCLPFRPMPCYLQEEDHQLALRFSKLYLFVPKLAFDARA